MSKTKWMHSPYCRMRLILSIVEPRLMIDADYPKQYFKKIKKPSMN